jgi:hypothetical protein
MINCIIIYIDKINSYDIILMIQFGNIDEIIGIIK